MSRRDNGWSDLVLLRCVRWLEFEVRLIEEGLSDDNFKVGVSVVFLGCDLIL